MIRVGPTSLEELLGMRVRDEGGGGGTNVFHFEHPHALVAPAVSKDDTRAGLFGVHLRVSKDPGDARLSRLVVTATDGHRIHRVAGPNKAFTDKAVDESGAEDLDVLLNPEAAATLAAGEFGHVIASPHFVCVTNARHGSTIHNRPTTGSRATDQLAVFPPSDYLFDPCRAYAAKANVAGGFKKEDLLAILRGAIDADGVELKEGNGKRGKEYVGPLLLLKAIGATFTTDYIADAARVLPKGSFIEITHASPEPGPRTARFGKEAYLQPLYLRSLAKFDAGTYLFEAAIMPRRI